MPPDTRAARFRGKKPKAEREPSTPDEILEAGVGNEESAEKWRASDAAKSVRFYQRALSDYQKGLHLLSNMQGSSDQNGGNLDRFNLEYNYARILYTITQYPRLRAEYSKEPPHVQLAEALKAHRAASNTAKTIYQNTANSTRAEQGEAAYADILFNESQVLCSLAEALPDEISEASAPSPSALTDEAIQKFATCLEIQERRFERWRTMIAGEQATGTSDALSSAQWQARPQPDNASAAVEQRAAQQQNEEDETNVGEGSESDEQETAMVMETATLKTVIETWLELLRALTLFCESHPTTTPTARDIDSDLNELLEVKGRGYISRFLLDVPSQQNQSASKEWLEEEFPLLVDATTVTMKLLAGARGEMRYRQQQISAQDYAEEVYKSTGQIAWSDLIGEQNKWVAAALSARYEVLCTTSEALDDCASAIQDVEPGSSTELRWQLLSEALDTLTKASRIQGLDRGLVARMHQGRGDLEMERLSAIGPNMNADKTKDTLLRNAGVYYRGAAATAKSSIASSFSEARHPDHEVVRSASVRAAVATALAADGDGPLKELAQSLDEGTVTAEIQRMVDDDLVDVSWLRHIGLNF